jgi:uncharacterized membrane protein
MPDGTEAMVTIAITEVLTLVLAGTVSPLLLSLEGRDAPTLHIADHLRSDRLRTPSDLRLWRVEVASLIAITFAGPDQAGEALHALRQFEHRGALHLTDTAVIRKDPDGKVHTKNELDSGVELGLGVVGTLGLLIASVLPVAGLAVGLAGGALAGSQIHAGIDRHFMDRLRDDLRPGTSALLVMVADVKPYAVSEIREAMQPFHGTLYETALSPEVERTLRDVTKEQRDAPTT